MKMDGPYGDAVDLELPPGKRSEQTLAMYLLTAPFAHPAWSQYIMGVVMLDDRPDFPPPKLHFPEATHELFVFALDPGYGPYDPLSIKPFIEKEKLPLLTPVSVVVQFNSNDAHRKTLSEYAARDVVDGRLSPEPPFSIESNNKYWRAALGRYLSEMRHPSGSKG